MSLLPSIILHRNGLPNVEPARKRHCRVNAVADDSKFGSEASLTLSGAWRRVCARARTSE